MAWIGARNILLCLGLFVVASSFCSCAALTRLKALDKLREHSTHSQSQAEGSGLRHGRLLIGQKSLQGAKPKGISSTEKLLNLETDYQADMGWPEAKRAEGQVEGLSRLMPDNAAVKRLLKLEPKVECTGNSMKLQVQDVVSTPGSLFFVDRGTQLSPLPLSKLPPSCGYTTRSTRRDFVLIAPYDGCFVALEEDSYVLPLRWSGLPVRMSCPLMKPSAPSPPMVTCHSEGMVVKTEWTISLNDIKVNLKGIWEPLMKASAKCGFSVVVHPEGVVLSVHYAPCLEEKDGMYTLELSGNGESNILCPSLSATRAEPTKIPPKDLEQQTEMPSKWVHHPTLPHNSGSASDQSQSAQSAVPKVPDFPQNPELPKTVPPSNRPVAPGGQVPQSFFPLHHWPAQPERVPVEKKPLVQSPATQPPNGKVEGPFYPYFFMPPKYGIPVQRPELNPMPTFHPGQIQKPYYTIPLRPQPPKSETRATPPPVSTPPPQKLEGPPSSKSEHQEYKPLEPPVVPKPPVSQEQMYQPFYPYFWPQGPYQTDMQPTHQTPTPSQKGQVKQPLNLLNPERSKPEVPGNLLPSKPAPESIEPTQPEAPMGQVNQYPYPEPGLPTKPITVPQPEAPSGQYQLIYPYYYPQPENLPAEKPEHKPSYPQPSKIPGAGTDAGRPVPTEPPPDGQVYYTFNSYYPQQPQLPQPITLPPATTIQPPQVTIAQPSDGDIIPQGPQPDSPYMPPFYCPQSCPSGFSNCCPQIAFHQHLHHIVPAGHGSKDIPPVYPALPLLHSLAYSGLRNGLAAPPSQKQTETETQASTSAASNPLPPENEKQPHLLPPDGNHAVPGFRKPANQLPAYPYFVPNTYYPYLPQNQKLANFPQGQSAVNHYAPSERQAQSNNPVNPALQYVPYYIQSPEQQISQLLPGDMNSPSWPNLMSFISQYQQQEHVANQPNKPTAKELQPSSYSNQQTRPIGQSIVHRFLVPSQTLEEVPAPISNSSQPFVSGSTKPTTQEQTVQPNSESQSYELLQHGPPTMEPNSYKKDLIHRNLKLLPQNLNPPKNRPQHPDWLRRMSNPSTADVNYIARPGDNSESLQLFISATDGSHFVPLPQDPSFSTAHLKPEFLESLKGMWKPIKPLGSSQRIPAHVPRSAFQQWSSAGHHQRD
uniref:Proline-rich extensin-like protein EPR1 n=1 Tax=Scophthalmus maximus TaxID=52904 RepID=A0A8D3E391_SCOMX